MDNLDLVNRVGVPLLLSWTS